MRGPRAALLVRRDNRKMRSVHLRRLWRKCEQLRYVGPMCGDVCTLRDERLRRRALRSGRGMCVRERGSGLRGRLRRRGRMPSRDPSLHVWIELRLVPRLQEGMRREVGELAVDERRSRRVRSGTSALLLRTVSANGSRASVSRSPSRRSGCRGPAPPGLPRRCGPPCRASGTAPGTPRRRGASRSPRGSRACRRRGPR